MTCYNQILVALDLTEDSKLVCQRALNAANSIYSDEKPAKVHLTFLHVVEFAYQVSVAYEPMFYPVFEDLSKNEEELVQLSKDKMNELIKGFNINKNIHCESLTLLGTPKSEILRLAEEKSVDLIVCGSHGRSGFELLLGSTANAILHHAPCDVLAVRTQKS